MYIALIKQIVTHIISSTLDSSRYDTIATTVRSKPLLCSEDVAKYASRYSRAIQEHFVLYGLDTKNKIRLEKIIYIGTPNGCHVLPADVFRPAIIAGVTRIIIAHNHPSGDTTPSPDDVALTKRLCEAGALLGIPVLDHVIVGINGHTSLRDLGIIS